MRTCSCAPGGRSCAACGEACSASQPMTKRNQGKPAPPGSSCGRRPAARSVFLRRRTGGRIFLHKCLHKCSTNIHIYDINLKGNPSHLRIRSCPRTDTPHQKTDMSAISPRGRSTTDWGNAYDCPMLTAAGAFRCGGPGPAARRPFPIHAHTTVKFLGKGGPSCANPCRRGSALPHPRASITAENIRQERGAAHEADAAAVPGVCLHGFRRVQH